MKQEERLLKKGREEQEERLLKRGRGDGIVQDFNKTCTFFVHVEKILYLCAVFRKKNEVRL